MFYYFSNTRNGNRPNKVGQRLRVAVIISLKNWGPIESKSEIKYV